MNSTHNNSSITRQLQLVFALSILILLASSYASFYTNKKLIDSSELVNHTNEVIISAERMMSSVKDAETGQRGYIITGDRIFLEPYNGGYERTLKLLAHLKQLTVDNPVQQENVRKAKVIIDQRFAQMQHVLQASNSTSSIAERSQMFLSSHEEMTKGKLIMDDLRVLVADIGAEEKRLLKLRIAEQEKYTSYTPVMVVIAAIISVLISLLAYFRIKSDLDARVRKQKEDEEKYINTTNRIAAMEEVTRKIAGGDLKARSLDDAKDELGRISVALNNMVESLAGNFNELERRNWLQTGAVNIGNAIRGERFIKNVSQKVINSLTAYLKAPVGTLYVADKNQHMKLYGSYATNNAPAEIHAGSGLIGQVVQNKQLLITDNLPNEYLSIHSSIGNTNPVSVIIFPLLFDNHVVGVVELGLLHKPTDNDIEFLTNNAEAIAIGINAAVNYEKMQDLLEETQAQSEELQSQHSELENINAELEIQTEKLQASEEELRVQQEELQQANQELEERSRMLEEKNHQIVEKNIEVQRKAEELALSTKYKSEFMANMSHELRTPLNSILLLSRLLAENGQSNLNADQVEYAKVIQSSGNGLLALIDEILDLSKIEAGKMQLEYERVTVREITEDMRMLFEPMAKEKAISFSIAINEGVPLQIETDKLRIEQVLKNLLSNAMKFTRTGGITLSVSKNVQHENFIDFCVTDTGIGIPAEKQHLIFEAFQQADGSTRRKYGGTGLGLSISKELSKLLGGDIAIESEVAKGSTFTVSIPVSKAVMIDNIGEENNEHKLDDAPAMQMMPEERYKEYISDFIPESILDDRAGIAASDKSILIIEDDVNFARSLLEFTRQRGYKGIVTVRGDEGVELARQYKPAGVLLDIQLPVKSGWQVMEELKLNPGTRHIPVHIMSSHSVKKESILKGAVDFIDKPVAFEQMDEVFGKLEYVLSRKSKKVLIVEENSKHAKALAYFLGTFNINSEIKHDISESVDALKNDADCIILDMGIPDNNAYNTLEEIKKHEGLETLPIIVFTGKSLSLAEEQRIRKYADSIVIKTAHSYQRVLDEVSLFLHLVEESTTKQGKSGHNKLGALNDILKGKTVLIVDDDVRNIFSLTKALENVQMNIITATDGKEAIERLKEHKKIDLVLLDMMMPQMDGYEAARAIRQNAIWKKLPVIAVTAKAMTGDREKCIEAGASDYITKPVDIDQLLSLLRVWLYERA